MTELFPGWNLALVGGNEFERDDFGEFHGENLTRSSSESKEMEIQWDTLRESRPPVFKISPALPKTPTPQRRQDHYSLEPTMSEPLDTPRLTAATGAPSLRLKLNEEPCSWSSGCLCLTFDALGQKCRGSPPPAAAAVP